MNKTANRMLIALMDEYRRAAIDLKIVLEMLSEEEYSLIRDPDTTDPDCKSIQTVATHVISSGYAYANYLNTINVESWSDYDQPVPSPQIAILEIDKMLDYTESVLRSLWHHSEKVIESWSFHTRCNTTYDTEQLLEHAIVHILRHRRQIEHFTV